MKILYTILTIVGWLLLATICSWGLSLAATAPSDDRWVIAGAVGFFTIFFLPVLPILAEIWEENVSEGIV